MWKFVSRGIRESLERRVNCRTNVYSHTSQDGNTKSEVNQLSSDDHCRNKPLIPINQTLCKYFNISRGVGTADKVTDRSRGSRWNPKYSWTEAVEWSSLLAVGWVICQSLCLHRRFFGPDPDAAWRKRISQAHAVRISHLFNELLCIEPRHVLPITNCVGNDNECNTDKGFNELSYDSQKPYGPITIEEALQNAGDDFTRIHRIVMGEYEFQMGMKALEDKRHKDAVKHFSTGASLSSSASMFNLALCHELGVGTLADDKEAAKRYRAAADNGHADAMYNLGVFHAQGRGGLNVNMKMARELFTEAARLGQPQAQHALSLENSKPKLKIKEHETGGETIRCALIGKGQSDANKSLLVQLVGL